MQQVRKYIHLGLPKVLSTALQRGFFDAHPNIRHLGVGCGTNIDYINPEVELVVENYWLFCRELRYRAREESARAIFQKQFDLAENADEILAVGISNESLSVSYIPGQIDSPEKARRMHRAFGTGTQILLLIRNQRDLLRSLYRESVRIGYPKTFREFIEYSFVFQDRNYFHDLLYDEVYALYGQIFGEENVHLIPIEPHLSKGELVRDGSGSSTLVARLCSLLGVPQLPLEIPRLNDPLDASALRAMAAMNVESRHGLGTPVLGTANVHRSRQYFELDLQWPLPEDWVFGDVRTKRMLIEQAVAQGAVRPTNVDYSIPAELSERLFSAFEESNRKLQGMLSEQLPSSYFELLDEK